MSALLFPGQGSQVVGMCAEFYNNFSLVKNIFNAADEKLKYSISNLILKGPENDLKLTENTQPAILTVSYSIFQVLKHEFNLNLNSFKFFAGHSLGEYSALVCANSLKFEDALFLLHQRGKAMQTAVPLGKGSMLAVLGVKTFEIQNLINSIKGTVEVCEIANDNAEGQVIVSGDIKSINFFQNLLKEKKVKSIPLKVSAPFHCSLMHSAAENMKNKIKSTKFENLTHKIVNNVTSKPEENVEKIKELLVEQIFSTVRWRESILLMSENKVNNFVEIGPGKVLTGMVKRTIKNSNCFSINSIADIKNLPNEFKK